MTVFDPTPRLRWLFCMTHPDDELAICGWIRRLSALGAEVFVSWTTATPERIWEAHQAAKLLHVPAENLFFHKGTDRRVETQIAELLPSFQKMMDEVRPDRVVCGAFEQGHLDHDATNLMVNRTFGGPVLEVPLYHAYCQAIPTINRFATDEGGEVLRLLPQEVALKKKIAQSYPSQNIWGNMVWYSILDRFRSDQEPLGTVERMRFQQHFDFGRPNLPPKLARKVLRTERWRRWQEALDRLPATDRIPV